MEASTEALADQETSTESPAHHQTSTEAVSNVGASTEAVSYLEASAEALAGQETSAEGPEITDSESSAEDDGGQIEEEDLEDSGPEPISELDTEKTKDLHEEDEVFDPSAHRLRLDDFVNFAEFVKWPQFKEAFDKLGDKARLRHVSSAFHALKNILPRPSDRFLDDLTRIAVRDLSSARSNQLARIFYSCGKLRYINGTFMEAIAKKILQDKMIMEMDGCDISIIIYSIAILSRFQLLVFAAGKGMRVVDLYQLYAKETPPVLFPSQPEIIAALCNEIAIPNRLAGIKEQELASIVYGCGLLRAPEPMAMQTLAREIADSHRLLKLSAAEISNIVYGFGLNRFKDEAMLYSLCDHMIKMGRLIEMDTQHLANILYGFSRMGFAYSPILAAMVKEITSPERLKKFKQQELANIVSCAALIGIQDQGFYRTLGKEIVQPHRLPKYMDHNFSTIVLGLATVGVRDVTVLKALAEEMKRPERLPNYTSKDICDIIWGFNNLEFLDDGFILGLVAELRKPQRIRQSDAKVWQSCRAHVFSWSLAFPF